MNIKTDINRNLSSATIQQNLSKVRMLTSLPFKKNVHWKSKMTEMHFPCIGHLKMAGGRGIKEHYWNAIRTQTRECPPSTHPQKENLVSQTYYPIDVPPTTCLLRGRNMPLLMVLRGTWEEEKTINPTEKVGLQPPLSQSPIKASRTVAICKRKVNAVSEDMTNLRAASSTYSSARLKESGGRGFRLLFAITSFHQ